MNVPPSQVLLVEDDLEMPEVLAGLLQEANISLVHAANGAQALREVRNAPIDLVLLDLGLPDMSGFEVLRQIKEKSETQGIPVMVLTAWNSTKDKLRGFELGATDYLTKPFETAELRARVCAVLRAKRLQDELTRANRELTAARLAAKRLSHLGRARPAPPPARPETGPSTPIATPTALLCPLPPRKQSARAQA